MKFTDGNWLLRDGVQAFYPAQVHDVEATGRALDQFPDWRSDGGARMGARDA